MRYLHGFLCQTEFEACFSELMSHHSEKAFDANGARHALARAPLYPENLRMHGRLLGTLLENTSPKDEHFYIDVDAALLGEYVAAVAKQSLQGPVLERHEIESCEVGFQAMEEYIDPTRQGLEFIRAFMRECLQKEARANHKLFTQNSGGQSDVSKVKNHCLDLAMQALSQPYDVHPVLVVAVEQHAVCPTQILNVLNPADGSDVGELNGTLLHALKAFQPLVVQGCWRPESLLHWEQLWRSHWAWPEDNMHWNKPWMPKFVGIMVREYGARLPASLNFLRLKKDNASQAAVQAFFPLPLTQCDSGELLFALVSLMPPHGEESSHNQRLFGELLQEHHPVLHAALKMHVEMYPSHSAAVSAWPALLDVFRTIVFGISVAPDVGIDARVFE